MNISQYIPVFIKTAANAGKEILRIYNEDDFGVRLKSDDSPLTRADVASHGVIKKALNNKFPSLPLLSEEGKDIPFEERRKWQMFVCIDPLDGTKEFIKRNGEFTINIALIHDHRPVIGVIYVPVKDTLYLGGTDIGSFRICGFYNLYSELNSWPFSHNHMVSLPSANRNRAFTIVGSRSHMNEETQNYINELQRNYRKIEMISAGSSLKFCLVAEGSADVYPRFAPTMEWDTAAGQAILEGAGGSVHYTDSELPLEYNKPNLINPSFIATLNY